MFSWIFQIIFVPLQCNKIFTKTISNDLKQICYQNLWQVGVRLADVSNHRRPESGSGEASKMDQEGSTVSPTALGPGTLGIR